MNTSEQGNANLSTVLPLLRRRLRVVLFCAVLVPTAAVGFSLTQEKQYSATASLLFRDPQLDQKLFGSTFVAPSSDPEREAATNVKLVSLNVVAERTERRIPNAGSVLDKVVISAQGESDVVAIEATDSDPDMAARIANTFAAEYIAFRRQADRAKIRDAERLVSRQLQDQSAQGAANDRAQDLRKRSEELQVLASLQTGNAELVERAERPSSPSSPKVAQNGILGAGIGLLLGVLLAFVLERVDRRIRDPKEMEAIFQRPLLGTVPDSRVLARSEQAGRGVAVQEREAFRMLRANLRYFNVDRNVKTVLVTSAAPGDGKTTVAWNLAVAAASTGSSVLVIEADLRHPRFPALTGLHPGVGLSTVLAGEATLRRALQQVPVSEGANGRPPRTLDVLFAGPLPPNPTDLLESERMHELLDEAESEYDFVVIDTPPTAVVSDAVPLVKRVGGVIIVGRLGKSTRESVSQLREQLENLDAPTLGVVVNGVDSDTDAYGYGYEYGLAADDEAAKTGRGAVTRA